MFIHTIFLAQSFTYSGSVKDAQLKEAIPSVVITDTETNNQTVSSADGSFIIELSSSGTILEFSSIGYQTLTLEVTTVTSPEVFLLPSTYGLSEVAVTALGLERSTLDLSYALQSLDSKQISEVKSPNFIDNLSGQVAGLTVNQGATGVVSTSKITLRGEPSFSNNNPLFVVDGVPVNNSSILNFTSEAAAGFQEVDFGNGAMELAQDDIENVSVLKGPAAAALYGTRAANGVILITTKTPSSYNGLGVSINSSTFVETPFKLPEFQNKYGQGNSGEFAFIDGLGGGVNDNITYSWGPELDAGNETTQFDGVVTLPNGEEVRGGDVAVHGGLPIQPSELVSHPDNLKDFYQTGVTTINNVAISNSSKKGSFRVSFTDLKSNSYIPNVGLDRRTAHSKLVFKPTDKVQVTTSLSYINSSSENRPSGGYGSENINYSLVAWGPRSLDVSALEDYWQPGLENLQQYSFNYTFFDNPYFILNENTNSFNRNRLFGNLAVNYDITDRLNLLVMSGLDFSDEDREYKRAFSTNRFRSGAYALQNVGYLERNSNFLLTHTTDKDLFSFEVSVGGNRMYQEASSNQTQTQTLAQPRIYNFSNAASPIEAFQLMSEKRINSFYGIAKLNYSDFFFLDITGRTDWSSALASPISVDNTSFFYPSVSSSVILSNILELPKSISFFKVRGSLAQVGNDTDPYRTSTAYFAQTPFNSQPTFSAQNTIPNPNLRPEQISALEVGADIRFFNNRLNLDVTYYNSVTENQIISLPIAESSGFNQQIVNGGSVSTAGLEVVLSATPIRKADFKWNTLFNFSRNVSKVNELPAGVDAITLAYSRVYDNNNQTVWFQVEEGGRIGDIYGTGYAKNENGDFIINPETNNYIADNTLIKLGNYNPDFMLGFTNDFSYKQWQLNFLFDLRVGGEIVSRTQALAGVAGQLLETEDRPDAGIVAEGVINVGSEENPVWEENTIPINAETYYRTFYDRNHEENNTYSATYLKMRQFSLGYTFKGKGAKGFLKSGNDLTVSLIGRNIFAISEIPHFDPEQLAVQGNNFVSGVEDMSYPTARSIGLKLGYQF